MSALLFMVSVSKQGSEFFHQIVNHVHSNALTVDRNTSEIRIELDQRESASGLAVLERDTLHLEAFGWVAVKQPYIQLPNGKQDLAHKLCQVQVKNKLCYRACILLLWGTFAMSFFVSYCRCVFAFGPVLSNLEGIQWLYSLNVLEC